MKVPLHIILGIPFDGKGVTHSCEEVMLGIASEEFEISFIVPRLNKPMKHPQIKVIEALPSWARWPIPYKFVKQLTCSRLATVFHSNFSRAHPEAFVYFWSFEFVEFVKELRLRGFTTVWDKTNCHRGTVKKILDDAYQKAGLEPTHGVSARSVEQEQIFLAEIDHVFCPSLLVRNSLIEHGVPEEKLWLTNYGWSSARFERRSRYVRPRGEGVTFVFVGSICIRKGAHLLLEYWARSGVKGRLILAGTLEPAVEHLCRDFLSREDVVVRGYTEDVASIYELADAFVFPTLEEGAPLVTYEAAGCGLPIVTSPMGAAGIIENNINGDVIDPYAAESWVETFRLLENSKDERQRSGLAARESAQQFHLVSVRRETT